jgi:long-chain fatty acid transport protein
MKLVFKLSVLFFYFTFLTYPQNGVRLIDFDAKSLGRGGTSIGSFDHAGLQMTNPAGLSFLNQQVLDVNFSLMAPSLHFKNNLNDADGANNLFPLPSISYVHQYPNSKWTWGTGFFTAGGMGADFSLKHKLFVNQDGSFNAQEYHSQLATIQGGFSVAYKISDQLSAGVSLHLVYSMLEFGMPYSLDPSVMKGTAMPGMTFGQMFAAPPSAGGFGYSEVTALAKMSNLSAIGFNGKIGFAYKVNNDLSLGFSYTLPTSFTYKNGKASMDMTAQFNDAFGKAVMGYLAQNPSKTPAEAQAAVGAQFAGIGIDFSKGVVADYALEVELASPQSFGFGFSYKTSDVFTLSGDLEWLNWKKAFDKMTLNLSGGTNANINKMLGNDGTFTLDFPLLWENSVIVKLGGEYTVNNSLQLRFGYSYGSNPVPQTTVFPVFPAIVDQHLMLGGSYKAMDMLTLHAAFEMALSKSLEATNPSLIADEYNGSTSKLGTLLFHLGASYNF